VRLSHVFLSRDRHADKLDPAAASVLAALQSPTPPAFDTLGDPVPIGPTAGLMTQRDLEKFFGTGFASRVMHLDPGVWSGPLPSAYGLHVVRVESREPDRLPSLAAVRNQVEHAYRREQGQVAYTAFLHRLRAKYGVDVAPEQSGSATVDSLATTPVETPPGEGGSSQHTHAAWVGVSGRTAVDWISHKILPFALRRPVVLGPSRSAVPRLSTLASTGGAR